MKVTLRLLLLGTLLAAQSSSAGLFDCFRRNAEKNLATRAAHQSEVSMPSLLLNRVAAVGTEIDHEVQATGMLPRGSAILTSSGNLSQHGIQHIIHAASGSMSEGLGPKFEPTAQSVADSVHNALDLARANGDHRVAVPFIGGKIFVQRIGVSAQALAERVVEAAIRNRGDLELRFVTFGEEDTELFQRALAKFGSGLTATQAAVTPGSITDFSVHGATAIVNAANMEAKFGGDEHGGGGLSGAIGRATGHFQEINAEAQAAIRNFYAGSSR